MKAEGKKLITICTDACFFNAMIRCEGNGYRVRGSHRPEAVMTVCVYIAHGNAVHAANSCYLSQVQHTHV